ncbi:tail fiber assembly protein [Morganella morganii]|uniref:tail fiber assembly protein n=1 Tax=Morganella morganii TaxID=582 RepID=UPI000F84CFF1|nr:tail fiber assembly protein [Morganella morganii]RTY22504.1 tail fiber assembly protein [Morganella morganii subsp. morganii]
MERYFYSPGNNQFLAWSMLDDYKKAGSWPDDAVEISDIIYQEFGATPAPVGKIMAAGKDGLPSWSNIPPPSHEQLAANAESQKQALIAEVTSETEMLRTKLALKRIKPDEEVLLNAWLDYLDELETVDVTTAPDITWPVKPVV